MKITRHTAKDMRQALKLVREQLGPDAVILTSKRTPFGVEVTAAVDFDAGRVEAQAPSAEPRTFRPEEFAPQPPPAPQPAPRREDPYTIADHYAQAEDDVQQSVYARIQAEVQDARTASATTARGRNSDVKAAPSPAPARAVQERSSVPSRTAIEGVASKKAAAVQPSPINDDTHSALESAIDAYMGNSNVEDDE